MMVEIRSAQPRDAQRISILMAQLGYSVDAETVAARLERRDERREVFVAIQAGLAIGWAAVSLDDPFVEGFGARLEGLIVDENARSKGIGARLLERSETWARERGSTEIRVLSNVVRERAQGFYRRHGYDSVKRQHHLYKRLQEQNAVEIRRVTGEREFRALRELLAAYEEDLPEDLRHGSVPELSRLQSLYSAGNAALLAYDEGDPVGCVAVAALDRQNAVLARLFVRPRARGRGAARALTTAAIAFARENGFSRLRLDTHKDRLPAAYRLYLSLGFNDCAPYAAVAYACPTFMELRLQER